ncbi:hypothetical protein ANTHELSMS3_03431 [Antarctobacter heliothermus]|uniref:Uncharacterized protein n=1 Tax=Antarctobacter heliothermus TaxID=74033 RepID=A0A222E7X6_9RHOB|nr:hypothetical protein [Antarctobacter heliothermus]ASP22061.1 hypothetical protein ANTHELSMS3_03431 [Antarctobacter heliothermus]
MDLSTIKPANTLWTEPNWPRDRLGKPYDFARMGDGITRGLILSALVPKSKEGRSRWGHVHVLDVLHHRLFRATRRQKRKDHPAFGPYLYTWDALDTLAEQAAMPVKSLRNTMQDLKRWGIVHVAQASLSEPNSYRLTDQAFAVTQCLQALPLAVEWLLQDLDSLSTQERQNVIDLGDNLPKGDWQKLFPAWMAEPETQALIRKWHKSDDGSGRRLCPSQTGLHAHARKPVASALGASPAKSASKPGLKVVA